MGALCDSLDFRGGFGRALKVYNLKKVANIGALPGRVIDCSSAGEELRITRQTVDSHPMRGIRYRMIIGMLRFDGCHYHPPTSTKGRRWGDYPTRGRHVRVTPPTYLKRFECWVYRRRGAVARAIRRLEAEHMRRAPQSIW